MTLQPLTRLETRREGHGVSLSDQILDLIYEHRNTLRYSATTSSPNARALHLQKVAWYVSRNEPLHLVLPAFPAKSPNPEKTVGPLPDLGEVMALRLLNRLCCDIQRLYAPGAKLTLCSDGRVFSDLVRVSEASVGEYATALRNIIDEYGFDRIDTYQLEDVFPAHDFDAMREALVGTYGRSTETIREEVLRCEETRQLFNGIHRFIFEDQLVLDPHKSRNQIRGHSKQVAYEVIQRSNAWSALVERKFPRAVRLSIHPQSEFATKIGIRLVPSRDIWATPWHGVILFDGEAFSLVKRSEAIARQAKFVMVKGLAYFSLEGMTR